MKMTLTGRMLRHLLCYGAFVLFSNESVAQQVNILWITAEDLSPRFSFYGDATVATPNLDRLARQGVTYDRAFATYGVCAPSRHSIIMGMYPTATGAGAMRTWKRTSAINDITDTALLNLPVYEATPPPQAKCFTEYLRQAGYFCTNNAKNDYQFQPPITAWDEDGNQAHWRNRPDKDQPFFSVFNFEVTHESKIHQPPSPQAVDPSKVLVPPYYPDTETVRRDIAHHYDNIMILDRQVGELLKQLEEDGLTDQTVIFFYGDHGDGLPRAKRWVYDSGIQVPLVIRFPHAQKANTRDTNLVSFVDFAPTVLSLCNIPVPTHMHGRPFLGTKRGAPRKYIYAFRDRMDPAFETIRAVRGPRFKYIRNYRPDLPYIGFIPYRDRMLMMKEILHLRELGKLEPNQWQFALMSKPLEEIYDTQKDPHEINNLIGDPGYQSIVTKFRKANDEFQARFEDLGMISERELVRKLWPENGLQPKTDDPQIEVQNNQIHLQCASKGASIAYRFDQEHRWHLYSGPFSPKESTQIEVQAIRLGWKPSQVVKKQLD
jgi:arylsulfatase A-like enzyme